MMNLDKLLQEAKAGNEVSQYDLAEYYSKLLKNTTDENEIYEYSRQAVLWLKRSADQGYRPAIDALGEVNVRPARETTAGSDRLDMPEVPDEDEQTPQNKPEESEPIPAEEEEKPVENKQSNFYRMLRKRNIVLSCMVTVSMIVNVFLLFYCFASNWNLKPAKNSDIPISETDTLAAESPKLQEPDTAEPAESAEPDGDMSDNETETPVSEVTSEPVEEPEEQSCWLDLSQYPDLKVVPEEKDIFSDYEYYNVISETSLNMRCGPGTEYEKLGTIPSGAKVGAVSKMGGWFLVFYDGKYAWVSGQYLGD